MEENKNASAQKIALIKQMLDSAEKSIVSARRLLTEIAGGQALTAAGKDQLSRKLESLSVSEIDRVVEGVFDGQNMIGADKKIYPVPANYASKSKLVEGDTLKLTIAEDGSFIYKQIGPIERRKIIGTLMREDTGQYKVKTNDRYYKVLLASVTYFKASEGDEVTLVIPTEGQAEWGAVENVIKKAGSEGLEGTESGSFMIERGDEPAQEESEDEGANFVDLPTGIQELDLSAGKKKKSSKK